MFFLYIRILFCLLTFLTFKAMAYEEATYSIVDQNNFYEIRNYKDRLAIQVKYINSDGAFRKLFKYISGSNVNSKKINMTIPATQTNHNGGKVMQFFLPSNFTEKNAPAPTNKELDLITIKHGYYAVIKYSGRLTDKNFNKHKKILKNNLIKDNIKILGSAIRATYNGPFTLPFLRRNEVMFLIVWTDK